MKKLLFALLFIPALSFAVDQEHTINDLSGGMNSYISPNKIPQNTASYLQNFFTDVESLGVERNGSVKRDTTILGGGKAVTGLWRLLDNSGQEWIISFSSRTYYKNIVGGTPASIGWTVTSNNAPSCTVNLGKFWCVNGVDPLQWFDGTSTGAVASAPKGRLIAPWRSHVVIGNIPTELTTLYVSANNDGTNWTLGINATDPFTIYVGGANNGEYVRCMSPGLYLDALIIGQKYATWSLNGFTQADWQLRNISAEVGCIENGSMKEFDGSLMFLSARGLEEMRGTEISLVSEPVRNYTDSLVKNSASQRSNTQTTQVDWTAATLGNSNWVDTLTFPGKLQLTFPDYFTSLRDGTSGTKSVWTKGCYNSVFLPCTPSVSANGTLTLQAIPTTVDGSYVFAGNNSVRGTTEGTTFYMVISSSPVNTASDRKILSFAVKNAAGTTTDPRTSATGAFFSFKSTSTGTFYLSKVGFTSAGTPTLDGCSPRCTNDVLLGTPVYMWVNHNSYRVTMGNQTASGAHTVGSVNTAMFLSYHDGELSGTSSAQVDEFGLAPITTSLNSLITPSATSQLLTVGPNITSWDVVTIDDAKTGGTISYRFGSTTTASVSAISNWATITNGSIPSASTNPYAAFGVTFSQTVSSGSLYVDAFTVTWNEGGLAPSPVSGIYDRRYWLSFTTGTSGTLYQDTILVYQRNRTFSLLKGINSASFTYPLWRDKLYFGNSIGNGYVYEFDTGNTDEGAEITSQIQTRSYDLGSSIREKDLRNAWLSYTGNTGFSGNFNLSYFLDRSTTSFNLGNANMNDGTGQLAPKMPFPMSNALQGREFQYLLTKQGTRDRLKLHDITTKFSVKEER